MTKKNKPYFILDRNDLILEDLRDDLPPYMQDQVERTWGEKYLNLDASEKLPEIPDQRIKISWDDIGAPKDNILSSLTGSITENVLEELLDDFKKLESALELYDNTIEIDQELEGTNASFKGEFWALFTEVKRGRMFKSPESIEENLEHIIKLLYDNRVRSIDFNKTKFDYDREKINFVTYDDRTTNFPKHLNKLNKFIQQLIDGKKELDVEDFVKKNLQVELREMQVAVKHVMNGLKSGALKSIIKNVIDQVEEIRSGNIFPEILISSKPDDFLRMSISPFYSSCQNLYDGSEKRKLLSNVFDRNSKILYIIINKPFKDCRGNEHPYTPIIRSVIRKLQGDEYVLDQIYKPESLDLSIDKLQKLLNNKMDTAWFDDETWGNIYEIEYGVESEAVFTLPPTYSDKFTVSGHDSLITQIQNMDVEKAKELVIERTDYEPKRIEGSYIIFHDNSLEDTVYGMKKNPIRNLYYYFKQDDDKRLDIDNIFPFIESYLKSNPEMANNLYKYLSNVMRDEMLDYRKSIRHKIDPRSDLMGFIETNNLDGTIRELERSVKRHLLEIKLDKDKKRIIYKYIEYLFMYSDIENSGAHLELFWDEDEDDILLFEGVSENSVEQLDGQISDEEIIQHLMVDGFIDINTIESMKLDEKKKKMITNFLKAKYTNDLKFISYLHAIAEHGFSYKLYHEEIEKALTTFLK